MARSYRKTPCLGHSDTNGNQRYMRRKARRTHNKRRVRELLKAGGLGVDALCEAADETVFMTAQEADDSYWGHGYFGHMINPDDPDCWFTNVQAPKLIRK